ncbi:MAG: TIGR03560 family F420-dependent LLM class oxidoreductase [Actinophytocola sp.]|uniref:LLM class F420-dependent oxidoreductase n=1 Tax=Actinophytocola sp. TaxID=1872138 RepID=UPI0013260865|nr:LLM class F420-dependent oxidoreductase [Actinophytocola sp.]MPZ83568.1 TIGR03560 family F420-dependent LLM class oxidoreductase [Actinophytocola sp.]
MDLRIMIEPQQGASYDTQLRLALAAEELGFSGFFRSDHYLAMGDASGLPGPTDAWVTLGGLARETGTIRLGTMVTAGMFRLPGVLAIQVAQVDQMSGGRVELGLGAGWFEAEHTAYGIPFPEQRHARLAEQLDIVTGLWATPVGETFSYDGRHYTLADSPALPKPAQSPMPVIVGGMGRTRTPELAAKHATEFNTPFASVEDAAAQFERVRSALAAAGRSPGMVFSSAVTACVGKDDAEVARRAAAQGREVAELKANGVAGTPAEAAEKLRRYAGAGATRAYLQIMDMADLDHLAVIANEVRPQLT